MGVKRMFEWLYDSEVDLFKRTFALTSMTVAITLSIIFVWDIFIGESIQKLSALFLGVAGLYAMIFIGIHFDLTKIVGIITSLAVILFLIPMEFFTGDGVYGCTPLWMSFAFLYIGLNVRGIAKYVMLVGMLVCSLACYGIAFFYPDLLNKHDMKTAYLDSIASLVGVGFTLFIMISFLLTIYEKENEKARRQTKEIEDLNKSQNRFFSSMSHEIRTPINTIIGLNEMIMREDISKEVAEDAANIQSASQMLLHIINDILDMSKMQSGQMSLTPVSYQSGDMLSEIVGMFWIKAKEKGLNFKVDVSPELPMELYGDEVRIKQILINVVNNAIKYTREGDVSLSIECKKNGTRDAVVTYIVSDTGIGIKKENIPYLFTAFKRVDEDKNKYIEGTGLGLSIVKQLVDAMGGKITVNSVYTKGSTFIMYNLSFCYLKLFIVYCSITQR